MHRTPCVKGISMQNTVDQGVGRRRIRIVTFLVCILLHCFAWAEMEHDAFGPDYCRSAAAARGGDRLPGRVGPRDGAGGFPRPGRGRTPGRAPRAPTVIRSMGNIARSRLFRTWRPTPPWNAAPPWRRAWAASPASPEKLTRTTTTRLNCGQPAKGPNQRTAALTEINNVVWRRALMPAC